ncbi:MAG: hypothetical protein ACK4PI_01025 [Tepidisphaerales bacterium]
MPHHHAHLPSAQRHHAGPVVVASAAVAAAVALLAGCTRYDYALLEVPSGPPLQHAATAPTSDTTPPPAAPPTDLPLELVSADREVVIERLPLRYRFQVVDNRLVLRVFNSSPRRLELLGGASTVTDPSGQTHPLRRASLPSGAFAKVILPPLRPPPQPRDGPFVRGQGGFGPGLDRSDFGFSVGYTFADPPEQRIDDQTWTWPGEGTVRLRLAFRDHDTGETWTDTFRIARRRAP